MSSYLQLLGTDTPDACGSCALITDERRILFNCPEGAQRHASEARLRVSKVNTFFFTRVEVSSTMGLPGFLFTINDSGAKQAVFGGPFEEMKRFLLQFRESYFSYRKMEWNLIEPTLGDKTPERRFRIHCGAVADEPPVVSAGEVPPCRVENEEEDAPCAAPSAVAEPMNLPPPGTILFTESVCGVDIVAFHAGKSSPLCHSLRACSSFVGYAVIEQAKPVFNAALAKAQGVAPGPKFALLKRGEDVASDKDPFNVVAAASVVHWQYPTTCTLILDGDGTDVLCEAVTEVLRSMRHRYGGSKTCVDDMRESSSCFPVRTVFHLSQSYVSTSKTYQATLLNDAWWANITAGGVPPTHVNAHVASQCFSAFPTALVHRMHLSSLAPKYFPLSADGCEQQAAAAVWPFSVKYSLEERNVAKREGDQQGPMKYPTTTSAMNLLSPAFREKHLCVHSSVDPSLSVVKHQPWCLDRSDGRGDEEGSVLFLGTGSSVPSKYRNVSGITVQLPTRAFPHMPCPTDGEDMGSTNKKTSRGSPPRIILDAGEGTVGQLYAYYCIPSCTKEGLEGFRKCLAAIELIFISHSHADHNLGLLSLLEHIVWAREGESKVADSEHELGEQNGGSKCAASASTLSPLVVVAPQDFIEFVEGLGVIDFDVLRDRWNLHIDTFYSQGPMLSACPQRASMPRPRSSFVPRSPAMTTPLRGTRKRAGDDEPNTLKHFTHWCSLRGFRGAVFPVDHPAHAHGIVLQQETASSPEASRRVDEEAPFAILYSGDTRPNAQVVSQGQRFGPLTALIHEATFDDSLAEEAVMKRHSTTGEAIHVGRCCGAKSVILTHFSQRYPKLPPPSASQPTTTTTTGLASEGVLPSTCAVSDPLVVFSFDYMRIPLERQSLGTLSGLTPTFVALLEEYESWDSGTSKRLREE